MSAIMTLAHITALLAATAMLTLGAAGAASASTHPLSGHPAVAHPAEASQPQGKIYSRPDYKRACAAARAAHASCLALVRTNVAQHLQPSARPDAAPTGVGYGPPDLQSAYALPSSTAGSGETVAVVDAYNDPNAQADLDTYRSAYGLPACDAGCFSVVNENGQTSPLPSDAGSTGWDVEESLDIDMVSAICPNCHIDLVEANSASYDDLGTAVNAAVSLGAAFVSNSYGGSESSSDPTYDSEYYNHPGVAVTASAGDSGYGVEYPAASQYVTAVGGRSRPNGRTCPRPHPAPWISGPGCAGCAQPSAPVSGTERWPSPSSMPAPAVPRPSPSTWATCACPPAKAT